MPGSDTNSMTDQRFYTMKDLAKLFTVNVRTVRRWIDGGELVAHRFGRQLRIEKNDLDSYIKLRRQS